MRRLVIALAALIFAASQAFAAGAFVTRKEQSESGTIDTQYYDMSGTGVGPFLHVYVGADGAGGIGGGGGSSVSGSMTQPTDKSCAATTACPLLATTARKYLSIVNTTGSASNCRIGYGNTPSATTGDPISALSTTQGGSRTFDGSYVPSGVVSAFCDVASKIAVIEGGGS